MQRKSLMIALATSLGLAGAIAYAANSGAIAPLFATAASHAAAPAPAPVAADAFTATRVEPVRIAVKPAAPPTAVQVGDAASFGRNVRWLGKATGAAMVSTDCGAVHAEDPTLQCQQVDDYAVDTRFAFNDLGRIELPAGASNSMLCHWLTPLLQGYFYTPSTSLTVGRIVYSLTISIENPVLDDPAMINPVTRRPFNGRLGRSLGYEFEQALLQQGLPLTQVAFRQRTLTCDDATISKQQLVDIFGLTRMQADQFFANPMTVRFGVTGSVRYVSQATIWAGGRLVGD